MSVPDPSAVDWVPLWNLGATDLSGTRAQKPAAASAPGAFYYETDWTQTWRSLGGAWVRVGMASPRPVAPGQLTGFAPFLDGDEILLVDSIANPSYRWRLRYNAQSSSNRKWEYVGGTPLTVAYDTAEPNAAGWAAGNPSLTVPRDGEYLFAASAMFIISGTPLIGLALWTTGVVGPAAHATATGQYWALEVNERRIDLGANAVVSTAYYVSTGAQQVQQRRISCAPLRVG